MTCCENRDPKQNPGIVKVTSDSKTSVTDQGSDLARRLVVDDALGATTFRLEHEGYVLRFEELRTGTAMLFREEHDAGSRFVALDAYDRERILALIALFETDPKDTIASIDWQEDKEAGVLGSIPIGVAVVLGLAVVYGLYVEFFQ